MAQGNPASIKIDVQPDGVYMTLFNAMSGGKPSRLQALKLIEQYAIQEIDFLAINDMFKENGDIVRQKISNIPTIAQKPEEVLVKTAPDCLSATVEFIEPLNEGRLLTLEDVRKALETAGVRNGINEAELARVVRSHEYGIAYIVAKGVPAVEGKDGSLELHFNAEARSRKPKELPDGKVDYHSLNLIEIASKDQVLATVIPPVPGTDGLDVRGLPVAAKAVKPAPPLPRGKNTDTSDDGQRLIALTNGQLLYQNKRVDIHPVLDIKGSVDNSTGNISFNGAVNIKGNVVSGFTVEADGSIEIGGVVEGATVISRGDVLVAGGIQGQEKGVVQADGSVTVKFAENCTIISGGNIYADNIMHGSVRCKGDLEMMGKYGLLVGGSIIVGGDIRSKVIGSVMATATDIEVGFDPNALLEFKALQAEYTHTKSLYEKICAVVDNLMRLNEKSGLNDDKKRILLKSVHEKMFYRDRLMASQEKINRILPVLMQGNGKVYVESVVRAGVKLTIGNAVLYIRDDIQHCTLSNEGGKVAIGPYTG